MCGIAGFLLREAPAALHRLRPMCDVIRHRGPDDEGFHLDGRCAIGMRRLSIIDLSTGRQPIANEDNSVWIVFNGEIYSYQGLRRNLIAQGHRFHTQSDTETIVHLYEQEGVDGLAKLRGMFAFAIWDARDRSLLLVRDRFGKKPLYYADLPEGLFFGSELKCLRAAGVPLDQLDREALRLYFQFGYIPDPASPYTTIRKLPAGSWLRFHQDGRKEQGRYWRMPVPAEEPPSDRSYEQSLEEIRRVFDESVKLRMIADVPLGAFLSGGIDSSSVVASMARQSTQPVKTFSIGFEEAAFNELPYAKLVADKYGADHHEIMVRPDAVDLMSKLAGCFDEPFADTSAIPTYIVSQFAREYVKVALTGDGGDELFGGYRILFQLERLRKLDRIPAFGRKLLGLAARWLPYSAYGKNFLMMASRSTALARYFELNFVPYSLRRALLRPEWMLPADEAFLSQALSHCLVASPGADILTQALFFEATANLTGDMLVKVDRMSMANSLEVRCPLLDHELAELAATLPHAWKMNGGRGKDVFVRAMEDRLPGPILTKPKTGFAVPLRIWYRTTLRDFLRDHLLGHRFLNRGIASPEFVRQLIEEHERGRRDNATRLSMLLMLELWFQNEESVKAA